MNDEAVSTAARKLAGALEPFAGQVYFAQECHDGYEKLGFGPSPGEFGGVAGPEFTAYFCSRGSVMGQVPGEMIAAAFAVFNPTTVVPAVDAGWKITDAATICEVRTNGAVGQLTRILGAKPDGVDRANELLARAVATLRPEGRPLYAGLLSLGLPGEPLADAWRRADLLREYRGDSHTAAWISAGFDATEIGLLTELFWGIPTRTYVRSRAWSDDELDAAEARLVARGLLRDGVFTDAGRAAREAVEVATDRQCRPIVDALGDDVTELIDLLRTWDAPIQAQGGYPPSTPADMAEANR